MRYDADTSDDEDDLRPEDSISRRGDPIPDDPDQTANPSEESQLNETAQTQPKEGEASQTTEVKKKRIIRNPQPKLDAARITGNRGVGALEEIFKNFKPKGLINSPRDMYYYCLPHHYILV